LEKTSKIIKSNRQPNTTMPTKPCPEVPHLHIFLTPPRMVTQPPHWAAYASVYCIFCTLKLLQYLSMELSGKK